MEGHALPELKTVMGVVHLLPLGGQTGLQIHIHIHRQQRLAILVSNGCGTSIVGFIGDKRRRLLRDGDRQGFLLRIPACSSAAGQNAEAADDSKSKSHQLFHTNHPFFVLSSNFIK